MAENETGSSPKETDRRFINSETKLVKALGMTRVEEDHPVSWLRQYQKEIENGAFRLTFQNGKYSTDRGQRITLSVGNDQGSVLKEINLCQDKDFSETRDRIGLSLNGAGMFRREELETFGYDALFSVLQEMEQNGYLENLLAGSTEAN